ncbi:MAG: HAD family hydrolase [Bacteroidaceae bacterium]
MNRLENIKGIIFDYGGTIDTNGIHWAEVLWGIYTELHIAVDKESFREAYVYGERTLALKPLIQPEDNFYQVLKIKAGLQISYLIERKILNEGGSDKSLFYVEEIAKKGYEYVLNVLKSTRKVLSKLSMQYKLTLVSNFYGNIHTILKDFNLLCHLETVIESSVVGIRKPNPQIFQLGVDALNLEANEIVVVGDSFSKDILPAKIIGCRTVWLKGKGWEAEENDESLPDVVITDLAQLLVFL